MSRANTIYPATRFPQFADINAMIAAGERLDIHLAALTLNERGAEAVVQSAIRELVRVVSASEEHSKANMRRSREAVDLVRNVAAMRDLHSWQTPGSQWRLAVRSLEISTPKRLSVWPQSALRQVPIPSGSRIRSAMPHQCPFAPGATGNVVFEDIVFLSESMDFATGIDLNGLKEVRRIAQEAMPGEMVHGALHRAGPPKNADWQAKSLDWVLTGRRNNNEIDHISIHRGCNPCGFRAGITGRYGNALQPPTAPCAPNRQGCRPVGRRS